MDIQARVAELKRHQQYDQNAGTAENYIRLNRVRDGRIVGIRTTGSKKARIDLGDL